MNAGLWAASPPRGGWGETPWSGSMPFFCSDCP
jgi:hypothetical protein